uniref:PSI-F n=1 Tax=Odontella aurita TaxID=265563 RepID=A0A7S4JCX0_9STRA|mmetsp:Transcript_4395/g.12289  ORF Transcript_4395/g.12289 Transcript_4395/m.12289 type:complete len:171 (+) Transcript_4395:137-649(+)|eukprot:CAMPEP_0113553522 /NCGR_PEP_ID=MMETSP0015_2-20120614/15658_1 /TAXON_ID=2838 /ORGANISM="Odontella" /LENGTH=170 /DNA_ID=CAMNT_0000454597 /DNA_START=116 /DNA_END=628 /DNA_ORIENTATION=+ /assembly_acc=CAM_ASM_000160
MKILETSVAFALVATVSAFSIDRVQPYRVASAGASRFTTACYAMGPLARAKKLMDPEDYDRVVEEKMKREGLTRKLAEEEYNQFLENPPFYYALEKKEEYYKSLGYKDLFEGMIGEAEKEGRGDEVRQRILRFQQKSKLKALSVMVIFFASFYFARATYWNDPDSFLPGI